jgi:hypothetical protein
MGRASAQGNVTRTKRFLWELTRWGRARQDRNSRSGDVTVTASAPVGFAIEGAAGPRHRLLACWTVAIGFVCLGATADAVESAAESSVKAAFLYKFPAYVEWPDRLQIGTGPVEIGVMGDDAVQAALEELAMGRASDERGIRVRRVGNVAAVKGLHVLFIGDALVAARRDYIAAAHAASVLTVTEESDPTGVIDFVLVNGRVRFTISLTAAREAKLRISSRLLAVAQDVRKGEAE